MTQKFVKLKRKITDHDHNNQNITTQESDMYTAENCAARLKQAKFANKADIDNFVEKKDFDDN